MQTEVYIEVDSMLNNLNYLRYAYIFFSICYSNIFTCQELKMDGSLP